MTLRRLILFALLAASCRGPMSKSELWDNSGLPQFARAPDVAWTYRMPTPPAEFLPAGDNQTLVLSHRGIIFTIDLVEGKRSSKLWQPFRAGISAYMMDDAGQTLYFGAGDIDELWAYNPITGKKLWEETFAEVHGPIAHRENLLYGSTLNGDVAIFIDSTGERLATQQFGGRFYRGVRESEDYLLALSDEGILYALEPLAVSIDAATGEQQAAKIEVAWKKKLAVKRTAEITTYGDGALIVDSEGRLLFIDQADGDIRHEVRFDAPIYTAPTIIDNLAIIASADGKVTAVSMDDASIIWQTEGPGIIKQPLMLLSKSADEMQPILVPFERGHLVAYNAADGAQIWSYEHPIPFTLVRLSNEGILVTDVKNKLTYLHPDAE